MNTPLFFTVAVPPSGESRIRTYSDPAVAALDFALLRAVGGNRRILLGKARPGDDTKSIRESLIRKGFLST